MLEMSALHAVKGSNIPGFERAMAQLKTYYDDYRKVLPESARMYQMLGLNLLRLLSQNRIAEMHTELETIDAAQLSNVYIRHPLSIEQYLMEGSYNKVWHLRSNVPAEDNEIAQCMAKAYVNLPIPDAVTLLYFKTQDELMPFAKIHGWNVSLPDKKVYFAVTDDHKDEIPASKIIKDTLSYAQELERIV